MNSLLRRNTRRASLDAIRQAADELDDLAASGSKRAQQAREMARDWWERGSQSARDAAVVARERAGDVGMRTQRYVRDEPVKSMMIAAAAGVLIAGLLAFSKRDRY